MDSSSHETSLFEQQRQQQSRGPAADEILGQPPAIVVRRPVGTAATTGEPSASAFSGRRHLTLPTALSSDLVDNNRNRRNRNNWDMDETETETEPVGSCRGSGSNMLSSMFSNAFCIAHPYGGFEDLEERDEDISGTASGSRNIVELLAGYFPCT